MGWTAEREQGITIDVAYRFFSTDKRKFIVADTPGHEQYTQNLVTGVRPPIAVILIDARKGVLTQTRRHSYLVSLIGIRHIVLAINKMDMVGFSKDVFDAILKDYQAFAAHRLDLHRRYSDLGVIMESCVEAGGSPFPSPGAGAPGSPVGTIWSGQGGGADARRTRLPTPLDPRPGVSHRHEQAVRPAPGPAFRWRVPRSRFCRVRQ